MNNPTTIESEEFTDAGWDDFLTLPLNDLLAEYADSGFPQQSASGFGERYKLALTFVKLLSVVAVVAVGAVLLATTRRADTVATGGVTAEAPLVCDAIDLRNGMSIPGHVPCVGGELLATGDLDAPWNGILSGWDIPGFMTVGGVWENWDDGTPDPSGFEIWDGANSHRDVDAPDNRYQEIRVTNIGPGEFSIHENRGLTGRSVTFRFIAEGESPTLDAIDPAVESATDVESDQFQITDGRSIAVQSQKRTSVLWSGEQSDDDVMVDWEFDDEMQPATVLVGSLVAEDAPIESIRGTLHLAPGDDGTDVGMSGGMFVRFYQGRELGLAGGKSAQLGLVNTPMGPIVDRTSGICPHEACSVRNSVEFVTAESVDLDASEGLGFNVSVEGDFMTMRLWSIATPTQPGSILTQPWTGGIGAASIELWATDWSFAGHVDNAVVTYASS